MFVIRKEQLEALGRPYTESLVELVRANLPDYYAAAGDAGARALVEVARERAARYSIVRCRDIGCYIAFMAGLGWSFDTDPRYSWAGAILQDPALNAVEKLAKLRETVASR